MPAKKAAVAEAAEESKLIDPDATKAPLVCGPGELLEIHPRLVYGLWSPQRETWWCDRHGVVFYTTEYTAALMQLQAIRAEANRTRYWGGYVVATPDEDGNGIVGE